jgi:acyl-CoA thioester hydrolase
MIKPTRPVPVPYENLNVVVLHDWIDQNGHMNVAYYLMAFDHAIGDVYGDIGIDYDDVARTGISTFAVDNHITYQNEVFANDRLRIETQLLGHDAKRWHWFQSMYHAERNYLAATCEWLVLCMDLKARKVVDKMPENLYARSQAVWQRHRDLAPPPEAGRFLSIKNKRR